MAHQILENDHAFYGGNKAAWHGLGTVIEEDVVSAKQALEYAKMDWDVVQVPVYADFNGQSVEIAGKVANVREDTGDVLAVVGEDYRVVQNAEAFGFLDDLLGGADLRFHTAGSLFNGRKVWGLARLNREILIGNDPDEAIDPFIAIATSHDGSLALSCWMTPIRIVCQNTLTWSMGNAKRVWKARHTMNVLNRTTDAREMLGMSSAYFDSLEAIGNMLINTKVSGSDMDAMISALFPMPHGMRSDEMDEGRVKTMVLNRREAIWDALDADDLANVKSTAWGFVQAVADWDDHDRYSKNDDIRANRVLFGNDGIKQRSLSIAQQFVTV
jgi:phage/plasmid-like protein (TIGR03299 family)